MDTCCACTEAGTHYGGVRSLEVNEGTLHLSLDDAAAGALHLDSKVSIALRMPAHTVDLVIAGIERTLGMAMSA